jgi:NAD-dependent DNA ligase
MSTPLNENGQVWDDRITERRRVDRAIHEMLGLIKGVLVDGDVSEREAAALQSWIAANPDATKLWPGSVLADRLQRVFADTVVTEEELADLRELLVATAGGSEMDLLVENPSTTLPFDTPEPLLNFSGVTYLLTGKFVFGTRRECHDAVVLRGGTVVERVNRSVNTLVVGCIGSRDWIHTSWGRKIEQVIELRKKGLPIQIVSEAHWTRHVNA